MSIINREDASIYSTNNPNFDKSYVFFYDNDIKRMVIKLFNDFIPKVREFKGFGGKTFRNNIFPDNFTIKSEKGDNYITVTICNKAGSPLYYFNFDSSSDYVDIFKVNNIWIDIYDKTTLVDSVHKRVLI